MQTCYDLHPVFVGLFCKRNLSIYLAQLLRGTCIIFGVCVARSVLNWMFCMYFVSILCHVYMYVYISICINLYIKIYLHIYINTHMYSCIYAKKGERGKDTAM